MNAQEIYNTVRDHLLKQGCKSERADERPRYYGPNGLKCSIGCLIRPEAYRPEIEDQNVGYKDVQRALANSGIDVEAHADLLWSLQILHDDYDPEDWAKGLSLIAKDANLEP